MARKCTVVAVHSSSGIIVADRVVEQSAAVHDGQWPVRSIIDNLTEAVLFLVYLG